MEAESKSSENTVQVVGLNSKVAAGRPKNSRRRGTGLGLSVAAIGIFLAWRSRPQDAASGSCDDLAFFDLDGRYCGQEGDMCKCFGRVRYGRLFSWSDDKLVDGSINCSGVEFGGSSVGMSSVKICKCFPTTCTIESGICTPEPCECPKPPGGYEYVKKQLMTSDGTKCWACEKKKAATGTLVNETSDFCPAQLGRCTLNKKCRCEKDSDVKRMMKTKDGKKCWTCAPVSESSGMGSESKAMFWMLPLLWPFMDFPKSMYQVFYGTRALSTFLALCLVGSFCQSCLPFLRLDRWFSFMAPCMRKGEFWRLFTYFVLHSDLQHLFINFLHLLDTLDIEGVPDLEVAPGVPLKCTPDSPADKICYPDIGMGFDHTVKVIALVLAFGALVGTLKNFGALVQGASSVCFGIDGALIALYSMFLGAGLDQQLKIPQFGAFFWMRIGIIAFHIIIDLFQSICGGGKETVGTLAHMASLVAGFSYVIIALPPMGDGSLFSGPQPYIIDCGLTSPRYTTMDAGTNDCLAFFSRGNGIEVELAQNIAMGILITGVFMSVVNMWFKRHISDGGIALCSCGDEKEGKPDAGDELKMQLAQAENDASTLRKELAVMERVVSSLNTARTALREAGQGSTAAAS